MAGGCFGNSPYDRYLENATNEYLESTMAPDEDEQEALDRAEERREAEWEDKQEQVRERRERGE